MKLKKAFCTFCAVCMLLSVVTTSGMAAEPRAEYAGTTMRCKVVVIDDSGEHVQDVNVPIPATATKAQQEQLVQSAALSVIGPNTRSVRGGYDTISQETMLGISSGWDWDVGGGKLAQTYARAIVQFSGITATGSLGKATKLIVTIRSNQSPGASQVETLDLNVYQGLVVFTSGRVTLKKDSTLSVVATTDQGGATIDTCTVFGDPFG